MGQKKEKDCFNDIVNIFSSDMSLPFVVFECILIHYYLVAHENRNAESQKMLHF